MTTRTFGFGQRAGQIVSHPSVYKDIHRRGDGLHHLGIAVGRETSPRGLE